MALTPLGKDEERPTPTTDGPPETAGHADGTTPANPAESDRLSMDLVFGLLSNERRRFVLSYLADNGSEATLSDLAEHIAAIENDKSVAAITSAERKAVYVGLYQAHLPKMDDANVIDYNRPRGTIALRSEADQLLPYLAVDREGSNRTNSPWRHLVPDPLLALGARLGE